MSLTVVLKTVPEFEDWLS